MRKLCIKNNNLTAEILPDYGGMLTKLAFKGKDVIYFNDENVHISNILSGGCPVLFPFPSRTENDEYFLDGKKYHMPFHGLVKSSAFSVKEVKEDEATIYITNSENSYKEHYPFDFLLELTFKLEGDSAWFITTVHNNSGKPMPHYFGWHHYFTMSERNKFKLHMDMKKCKNYMDGKEYAGEDINILDIGDYVFYEKGSNQLKIENSADGYNALITMDDAFESVVVCSIFEDRITVEPWLGIPNSININKYVQWVAPKACEIYKVKIDLSDN